MFQKRESLDVAKAVVSKVRGSEQIRPYDRLDHAFDHRAFDMSYSSALSYRPGQGRAHNRLKPFQHKAGKAS